LAYEAVHSSYPLAKNVVLPLCETNEMKKLMTVNNLIECDMFKGILEAEGIPCFIKNEYTSLSAGAGWTGPLGFAAPELWVIDDDQFDKAEELLREMEFESE
jgi:hypothetical protein